MEEIHSTDKSKESILFRFFSINVGSSHLSINRLERIVNSTQLKLIATWAPSKRPTTITIAPTRPLMMRRRWWISERVIAVTLELASTELELSDLLPLKKALSPKATQQILPTWQNLSTRRSWGVTSKVRVFWTKLTLGTVVSSIFRRGKFINLSARQGVDFFEGPTRPQMTRHARTYC